MSSDKVAIFICRETIIYIPCTMTEKLKTELQELTEFYKTANIPDHPIKINRYLTLLKPREFPAREIEKLKEFQGSDIVHESLFNHKSVKADLDGSVSHQ
jgi:hypothetical protein